MRGITSLFVTLLFSIKGAFSTGVERSKWDKTIVVHPTYFVPPATENIQRPYSILRNSPEAGSLHSSGHDKKLKGPIAVNRYKHFTSFADLVANRPRKSTKDNKIQEYKEAFESHPEVASIILDAQDKVKIARDTMKLRDHSDQNAWQSKLTFSLQEHLERAGFDEKSRGYILGYHRDNRVRQFDQRRIEQKKKKEGSNGLIQKEKWMQEYFGRKDKIRQYSRVRSAFTKDLDRLIRGRKLSTFEVASLAESLQSSYPDEYNSALRSYLKKKKYPPEEIAMIRGSRRLERQRKSGGRYAKGKMAEKQKAIEAVASTSASMANIEEETSHTADRNQVKESDKRAGSGTIKLNKRLKRTKVALRGQVASSSANTQKDNTKGGASIDEWECGPWWESGCFDD